MSTRSAAWPEAHVDAEQMARLAEGASTVFGFDMARVPFDQTGEVLLNGGAEDVRRATGESLRAGVHVLAPGCGIPGNGAGRARITGRSGGRLHAPGGKRRENDG